MPKAFILVVLAVLAGCSGMPPVQHLHQSQQTASACAAGEATWACQVQRYHDVSQ